MRRLIARLELVDDLVQRRNAVQDGRARIPRPDMRNRLGHLAHIVVGHRQQHRVHALRHQIAHQRALEQLEVQRARDRAHREAPVRVRRAAQVIGQDRRLGVVRVRVIEPVEKGGEGLHAGNVIRLGPGKKPARASKPQCRNSSGSRVGHEICEICAGFRHVPAVRARGCWRGAVRISGRREHCRPQAVCPYIGGRFGDCSLTAASPAPAMPGTIAGNGPMLAAAAACCTSAIPKARSTSSSASRTGLMTAGPGGA